MSKLKVVLADDHAILIESASHILSSNEHIELVGVASDGEQLEAMLNKRNPDVLVSDISMPGKSIFEIVKTINENHKDTKVLIFSMHDSGNYVYKALECNVNGYITKNSNASELTDAILKVSKGEEYYSQSISQVIAKGYKYNISYLHEKNSPLSQLSKREREVLSYLAEGYTSKQIAEKLFLSTRTVSNHRANMLQKCGLSTTIELVKLYLEEQSQAYLN